MKSTNFETATSAEPNHYTTARDMATLSRAVVRDFPQYYAWYGLREFTGTTSRSTTERPPAARSYRRWHQDGHTDTAGYCLITSAKRGGMRLTSVVLDSPSIKAREDASAALLNYG